MADGKFFSLKRSWKIISVRTRSGAGDTWSLVSVWWGGAGQAGASNITEQMPASNITELRDLGQVT